MRIVTIVLLTGCVGQQGKPGKAGEEGPAGPPGEGLVWKDPAGTILEGAYPSPNHSYAIALQSNGVFFEYTALGGRAFLNEYDSTKMNRYYLTTNCSGDAFVLIGIPPGMAFKYDNRIIALPSDVEVQITMGSYSDGTCHSGQWVADFTKVKAIDALPTLPIPPLPPGPFHLDKV